MDFAHTCWSDAAESERLEAFSGHPQIGDLSALKNRFAATASAEQGQVAAATEETLLALKSANDAYLEKFGFIFIVCATGKSAEEMLELVNERLPNSRQEELDNGAIEQGNTAGEQSAHAEAQRVKDALEEALLMKNPTSQRPGESHNHFA